MRASNPSSSNGHTRSDSLGLAMAIAIGLHNIPEGFLVAMPIYFATGSKAKALFWASLSGVFEFFGAFMTWLVFGDNLSADFFGVVCHVLHTYMLGGLRLISARQQPCHHSGY